MSRHPRAADRTPRPAPGRALGPSACTRLGRGSGPGPTKEPLKPSGRPNARWKPDRRAGATRARFEALAPGLVLIGHAFITLYWSARQWPAQVELDFASTLPALTPSPRTCHQLTAAATASSGGSGGACMRDLRQHAQQRARYGDRAGVPQRRAGLALGLHLGRALRAQRQVVRRAQVRGHPQLAVDERSDRFGREVLSGAELPRPDRRVALRGELRGQPGESATEHVSRVDHHPAPLRWSRRTTVLTRM